MICNAFGNKGIRIGFVCFKQKFGNIF